MDEATAPAEAGTAAAAGAEPFAAAPGALPDGVRAYLLIAAMWVRSTLAYRASFVMMTVGQFAVTGLEFAALLMMFGHTRTLGGFDRAEVAFLYGTSGMSLGLADLVVGNLDQLGQRVRDGTFDVLLIRPVPVYAQATADRFAVRRIGRITQAAAVLAWSLAVLHLHWTWDRAVLVPVMVVAGAAIFGSVYTLGAAFQFWATEAAEVQNSFTYGGNTLTQYPPTVFARDLVRAVTFVIPLAFVNWMPALRVLGRPDPLGLPGFFDYASPLVAAAACAVAAAAWRVGLRNYRSTGS